MDKKVKIPFKAKQNVINALSANYFYKSNKCATAVGKKRAMQILNDEYLSINTVKRTFSYLSRAKAYDMNDWSKCGTISYNLWGGDEMYFYLKKILKK
jgi:hypothetical protein